VFWYGKSAKTLFFAPQTPLFSPKPLHISEKSSNFAADFERKFAVPLQIFNENPQ